MSFFLSFFLFVSLFLSVTTIVLDSHQLDSRSDKDAQRHGRAEDARSSRPYSTCNLLEITKKEAFFSLFYSHLFLFYSFKTSCLEMNEYFTSSEEHGVER